MDGAQILIAGIGGLGGAWAQRAHEKTGHGIDLVLIDADESTFDSPDAHVIRLGRDLDSAGCAALPPLGEQRMRQAAGVTRTLLEGVEMVILLTGLGGGTGTGAAPEFARQARLSGAIVISIAAIPFEAQETRMKVSREGLPKLEANSDVCVRLELDRLAWQARERGIDWRLGASWVEEFVDGLVRTLMRLGLINLDMMDLKTIVGHAGGSTLMVGQGNPDDANSLLEDALSAPLANLSLDGAKACLLQIEGGPGMTVGQVGLIADAFTARFDDNAQVILGARVSDDLQGQIRVVAVVAGLAETTGLSLV
jgi:cell division protein FtsZ